MTPTYIALGALALAIAAATRWFRAVHNVKLPNSRMGYLFVMLIVTVAAIASLVAGVGWLGGIAAGIAVVIAGFFFLTVAISKQVTGTGAIAVGDSLPGFTAIDENGEQFDSAVLAGNPVLIKFFRGHW